MNMYKIGTSPWDEDEMRDAVPEFVRLLDRAPFRTNEGGMGPPHQFLAWFVARRLNPETIVESGVWKGAGTWILEQACPDAQIICLDPNPEIQTYKASNASYHCTDFDNFDWSDVDRENALLFFDDHQNAYDRIKTSYLWGFRHLLFEDNYPPGYGDCYSPRKLFAGEGYRPFLQRRSLRDRIRDRVVGMMGASVYTGQVPATDAHGAAMARITEVYAELPPVLRAERTRFGPSWDEIPAPSPLFSSAEEAPAVFAQTAQRYTYMGYFRLRSAAWHGSPPYPSPTAHADGPTRS